MRNFDTGATRDTDTGKLDFEGFLSHDVLVSYAVYMNQNRRQADGKLRDSDNWQKGIPETVYMKSMWRHFMDAWKAHRTGDRQLLTESLNALLFNVMGMQFENLKKVDESVKSVSEAMESFAGRQLTPLNKIPMYDYEDDPPTAEGLTGYELRRLDGG